MGKNLIQQRRGRGTARFRSPGFKYNIKARYNAVSEVMLKGTVKEFVHCPLFSAPLAKIYYDNGDISYNPAPEGIRIGAKIESGEGAKVKFGNILPLKDIPEGTIIFNIESNPGDGGKFVRASGGSARLSSRMEKFVTITLPSGKIKKFNPECRATIGILAGGGRLEKPIVKAGKAHFKYKAKNKMWPIVCGQSMNSVDHPFGKKSSHTKGRPHQASRNAPPGRKVGSLSPRRSGNKR